MWALLVPCLEAAKIAQVFDADDFDAGSGCIIDGAGLKAAEAAEKGVGGTGVEVEGWLSIGVRKSCTRAAVTDTATGISKGVVPCEIYDETGFELLSLATLEEAQHDNGLLL